MAPSNTMSAGRNFASFSSSASAGEKPAKRFVMGARTGTLAAILTNQAEIQTADLPPGRYTASATPMIGEQAIGRVSRVFEIVNP